jgi:molybdenum cofactor synthesis domain-containing protein
MKPLKNLMSSEEALQTILDNVQPKQKVEEIIIGDANNRILAEKVISPFDIPPFNRSGMDGYAVKAESVAGADRVLKLMGEVFAGEDKNPEIKDGECVKIATGARVPDSCNSVVTVENTEARGNTVIVYEPVLPFKHVSMKGADIKKGEIVLKKGEILTPPRIGVLAALGIGRVKVFEKPLIGIISTGNEIVPLGSRLPAGKSYDINTFTLKSIVERNFSIPVVHPIVKDDKKKLKEMIEKGLRNSDMVVLSGGSSMGERDLIPDILGNSVKFHGVKVKPGKPMLFACVNEKPVLGLPGFPTSCLTNAYIFLVPALRKMANAPNREEKVVKVRMAQSVQSSPGRKQRITVRIENGKAYNVYKESSTITSFADAIGYVEIGEGVDLLERNEEVEVKIFNW